MNLQIYVRKNPIAKWPPPQAPLSYSNKDLAPSEVEPSPLFILSYE